ncbi:MAG: sugar MFS transporter [Ignavibacteriales bacterium]|nr:sugar MFS transporter [Ignavibacteriales bacterium]
MNKTTPEYTTEINSEKTNYTFALSVLTSLFFMWGFITCLNGILIPHLKALFSLSYKEVMLIQFSFYTAYALLSIPIGKFVGRFGSQKIIVAGLITGGIGCLGFYPAAGYQLYPMFLISLFVLASGITMLEVSANPFVAILGKQETAASRLTFTQAFNSLGTTIAPYLGSFFILSIAVKAPVELQMMSAAEISAYKFEQSNTVQAPYLVLASVLFFLAIIFSVIKLPKHENGKVAGAVVENKNYDHIHGRVWNYKHLVLGAIGIFFYVGAEVSIGSFLVNYIGQPDIAGFNPAEAGKYISFYWGGAMIGRFIGSFVQRKIKPAKVLAFNSIAASLLVTASMFSFGLTAMWLILAVGLFNSIMYPTIFTLAIDGLGKHTGSASGILCTAIVGGALIPLTQGFFADNIGIHHAFFIPVVCYLYIAFYGIKGHKHFYQNIL